MSLTGWCGGCNLLLELSAIVLWGQLTERRAQQASCDPLPVLLLIQLVSPCTHRMQALQ